MTDRIIPAGVWIVRQQTWFHGDHPTSKSLFFYIIIISIDSFLMSAVVLLAFVWEREREGWRGWIFSLNPSYSERKREVDRFSPSFCFLLALPGKCSPTANWSKRFWNTKNTTTKKKKQPLPGLQFNECVRLHRRLRIQQWQPSSAAAYSSVTTGGLVT